MRIYLCSRYSRREQMRSVRDELVRIGHTVTSRWIDTEWELTDQGSTSAPPEKREEFCLKDIEDLEAAGTIIAFTEPPDGKKGRGGRHVEFGRAISRGMALIVVGRRENIFHHHPNVHFYENQWDMVRALTPPQKRPVASET